MQMQVKRIGIRYRARERELSATCMMVWPRSYRGSGLASARQTFYCGRIREPGALSEGFRKSRGRTTPVSRRSGGRSARSGTTSRFSEFWCASERASSRPCNKFVDPDWRRNTGRAYCSGTACAAVASTGRSSTAVATGKSCTAVPAGRSCITVATGNCCARVITEIR